jgi:hypothetical protein
MRRLRHSIQTSRFALQIHGRFIDMTRKSSAVRLALLSTIAVLVLALAPSAVAGKGGSNTPGSGCSISPSQVVLDQSWTVSAWALPTNSTVNMIITFPDGAQSIGAITVARNGTFTTTGNSNMSASWGFIAPEQTGTYSYQFVGRIKWPAGTFTQSYARCSVVVS